MIVNAEGVECALGFVCQCLKLSSGLCLSSNITKGWIDIPLVTSGLHLEHCPWRERKIKSKTEKLSFSETHVQNRSPPPQVWWSVSLGMPVQLLGFLPELHLNHWRASMWLGLNYVGGAKNVTSLQNQHPDTIHMGPNYTLFCFWILDISCQTRGVMGVPCLGCQTIFEI